MGVLLVQLAALLIFFFATERYLAELTPILGLLALIGFWQLFQRLASDRIWRSLAAIIAILFAIVTILAGGLLAISSYQERFLTTNPALMGQLINLFTY